MSQRFAISSPSQLTAVLQSLRRSRGLNQKQLGSMLGVGQSRIGKLEKCPSVASFKQLNRLISALGGRLVIEVPTALGASGTGAEPDFHGCRGHR
jgi:HTH-type transcriptional regulator/antitoxin HipB